MLSKADILSASCNIKVVLPKLGIAPIVIKPFGSPLLNILSSLLKQVGIFLPYYHL